MQLDQTSASPTNTWRHLPAVSKPYLGDRHVTALGRVGSLSEPRMVDLGSAPYAAAPKVKGSHRVSDLHVNFYGSTTLVGLELTSAGRALNATGHYDGLDKFVKQNQQWYRAGNACSPSEQLLQAERNAAQKAITEPVSWAKAELRQSEGGGKK